MHHSDLEGKEQATTIDLDFDDDDFPSPATSPTKHIVNSPSPSKRMDELHEIAIQIYSFKVVPDQALFQPVWVEILTILVTKGLKNFNPSV